VAQQLHMEAEYLELRTKHPFIIARGGQSDYRTIWVRLRDADGVAWHVPNGEIKRVANFSQRLPSEGQHDATRNRDVEGLDEPVPQDEPGRDDR